MSSTSVGNIGCTSFRGLVRDSFKRLLLIRWFSKDMWIAGCRALPAEVHGIVENQMGKVMEDGIDTGLTAQLLL